MPGTPETQLAVTKAWFAACLWAWAQALLSWATHRSRTEKAAAHAVIFLALLGLGGFMVNAEVSSMAVLAVFMALCIDVPVALVCLRQLSADDELLNDVLMVREQLWTRVAALWR